jgi:hypothetical protein
MSSYTVSKDPVRFDRRRFHTRISEPSYWARGRTWETTEAACDGSLVWGAYTGEGEMVGSARVVTDGVTFGWLCDVELEANARRLFPRGFSRPFAVRIRAGRSGTLRLAHGRQRTPAST